MPGNHWANGREVDKISSSIRIFLLCGWALNEGDAAFLSLSPVPGGGWRAALFFTEHTYVFTDHGVG